MPQFSIITIVRNDRAGLAKTAESVAAQTCRDFEWLIADGASTDGTAEFALGLNDAQTAAVSKPDRGIYDAMNSGIDRARGDYLLFLNAGDVFTSAETLQIVAARLGGGDIDFLYGDSLEAFAGGRQVYKAAQGHERVGYGMFACHQSMYFRRSLIGDLRYDTGLRVSGDYAFAADILKRQPRIVRLHEALSIFDLSGISIVNRRRGRQENWRVQRDVLGLSLPRRVLTRGAYLGTAMLATQFPWVYKALRFRK
jgi:putative colanic acid biosynthesis glycosyltransferase